MNNKYYTPKIEEFHVGFEIEVYNQSTSSWYKKTCTIESIQEDIIYVCGAAGMNWSLDGEDENHPSCRTKVKCLDKDDIEECGWRGQKANSVYFTKDNYRLVHWITDAERTINIYETYDGGTQEECIVRKAKIKNKKEFIKMLKQLGLWKK